MCPAGSASMTPDELAAIMRRGAEQAGRRMLRAIDGDMHPDELAALWLIVVEGYDTPVTGDDMLASDWLTAMGEVRSALDDIAE